MSPGKVGHILSLKAGGTRAPLSSQSGHALGVLSAGANKRDPACLGAHFQDAVRGSGMARSELHSFPSGLMMIVVAFMMIFSSLHCL